jgi:hypothetical protein
MTEFGKTTIAAVGAATDKVADMSTRLLQSGGAGLILLAITYFILGIVVGVELAR